MRSGNLGRGFLGDEDMFAGFFLAFVLEVCVHG